MRLLPLGLVLYTADMLVTVATSRHSKTTNRLRLGLRYLSICNFWLVYEFEVLDCNIDLSYDVVMIGLVDLASSLVPVKGLNDF